jgi:hypothetical protein
MSQSQIKDYFKRPSFPLRLENGSTTTSPAKSPQSNHGVAENRKSPIVSNLAPIADVWPPSLTPQLSSSPLSEPPSSLPSLIGSSQWRESSPSLPRKNTAQKIDVASDTGITNSSFVREGSEACDTSSRDGATGSSQRFVRDGVEVVPGSDEDGTDSYESFPSADELLSKFLNPRLSSLPTEDRADSLKSSHGKNTKRKQDIQAPKYKFSLESLVTHAVDDQEAEAGVAKLRAAYSNPKQQEGNGATVNDKSQAALREDVLVSAFDGEETDLQRLVSAVKRTEALERERPWSFFKQHINTPVSPEFPRESILPSARESFLRGSWLPQVACFFFFH